MKVLLDECLPRKMRADFPDVKIFTIQKMGWAGKKNGELLRLAEGKFDVFLTVDQNLRHQQNLRVFKIAIILICAKSNKYKIIKPLVPRIHQVMRIAQPGQLICIPDNEGENFSTYENVIREGRQEYAKGRTVNWEKVKKKLSRRRLFRKRASGMMPL